jgi:hypothetical protein
LDFDIVKKTNGGHNNPLQVLQAAAIWGVRFRGAFYAGKMFSCQTFDLPNHKHGPISYDRGQILCSVSKGKSATGLPDLSWYNIPKRKKYTKWP